MLAKSTPVPNKTHNNWFPVERDDAEVEDGGGRGQHIQTPAVRNTVIFTVLTSVGNSENVAPACRKTSLFRTQIKVVQ